MSQLMIQHYLNNLKDPRNTGRSVFDDIGEAILIYRLPNHGLLMQRVVGS